MPKTKDTHGSKETEILLHPSFFSLSLSLLLSLSLFNSLSLSCFLCLQVVCAKIPFIMLEKWINCISLYEIWHAFNRIMEFMLLLIHWLLCSWLMAHGVWLLLCFIWTIRNVQCSMFSILMRLRASKEETLRINKKNWYQFISRWIQWHFWPTNNILTYYCVSYSIPYLYF